MSSSNNEKFLDPVTSPTDFSKKAKTRRLSKFPIYVIAAVMVLIILVLVVVGAGKGSGNQSTDEDKTSERSAAHQRNAANLLRDIENPKPLKKEEPIKVETKPSMPGKPVQSLEEINQALADIDGLDDYKSGESKLSPPAPTIPTAPISVPEDTDLITIRQMKSDAFLKAVSSNSEVIGNGEQGSALGGDSVTRAALGGGITSGDEYLKKRQAQFSGSDEGMNFSGASGSGFGGLFGGGMNGSSSIVSSQGNNDWKLNSEIEAGSKYQLRSGTIIPSMLLTEINSDLAGIIQGQVSQNVYDTETGKFLLIPQGTRLIGQYDSDIVYGQSRVMIVWNRLIFPNGSALDIGEMPGADSMGKAGLNDKVNNHYGKMFINALLMSGITGVVSYTQDKNNDNNNESGNRSMSDSMSQALGQQFGQVTIEMIRKNMNVSPTLEIRAGFRFNIIVTKDIHFPGSYNN